MAAAARKDVFCAASHSVMHGDSHAPQALPHQQLARMPAGWEYTCIGHITQSTVARFALGPLPCCLLLLLGAHPHDAVLASQPLHLYLLMHWLRQSLRRQGCRRLPQHASPACITINPAYSTYMLPFLGATIFPQGFSVFADPCRTTQFGMSRTFHSILGFSASQPASMHPAVACWLAPTWHNLLFAIRPVPHLAALLMQPWRKWLFTGTAALGLQAQAPVACPDNSSAAFLGQHRLAPCASIFFHRRLQSLPLRAI